MIYAAAAPPWSLWRTRNATAKLPGGTSAGLTA